MKALVLDCGPEGWAKTKGLRLRDDIDPPLLDEARDPSDAKRVLIRPIATGFCGSDRSIYYRSAFREMLFGSMAQEGSDRRILGHELLGEIVAAGSIARSKWGLKPGDVVSAESHLFCGKCYQCRTGDTHVCANEKILGISMDGCFAELVKLPAKILWPTDLSKIRPEVGCIQEPFGNAVHACTKVDLRGKSLAIFGCGTIGLFAILVARALGATKIVAFEPIARNREMALALGADEVHSVDTRPSGGAAPFDEAAIGCVRAATSGLGVDVALEMAGSNSSVNNAIQAVKRGGDVILFGIKSGDFVIPRFDSIIAGGKSLHGVIGRQIFKTWYITRNLLESQQLGIQERIWDVILGGGQGSVVEFGEFEPACFERRLAEHPKIVLRYAR